MRTSRAELRWTLTVVAVLAVGSVAAGTVPTSGEHVEVVVATDHHTAPDGVLPATFTTSGHCPRGEVITWCDPTTGHGRIVGTQLGFSAAHRHMPSPLDGSSSDLIEVDVHQPGDLRVTATVPTTFTSRITAAPTADEVTLTQATWVVQDAEAGYHSFDVELSAAQPGTSELVEVTAELVAHDIPLVASSLDDVATTVGRRTSVLRMHSASTTEGSPPDFAATRQPPRWTSDRSLSIEADPRAISNGPYVGTVDGHVGAYPWLDDDVFGLMDQYGVNSAFVGSVWFDHDKTATEIRPDGVWWRTSDRLPFDHHDVIDQASAALLYLERPEEGFPAENGPTAVDDDDGTLQLEQFGPTGWTTGHTTATVALQVGLDRSRDPSRSGRSVALRSMMVEVDAVGGDLDNSSGAAERLGQPARFRAPTGWTITSASNSPTVRVQLDVTFDADDQGSYIDVTPVLRAGHVFPDEFDGQNYVNLIPVHLTMEHSNSLIPGSDPTMELTTTTRRATGFVPQPQTFRDGL